VEQKFIWVFAGNAKIVDMYRMKEGLLRSQIHWVTGTRELNGVFYDPPITAPLLHGFWDRPDAGELYSTAMSRGIHPVEVRL
jgi:hypothetical protein